jgi:hypothetical protein
VAGQFVDINFYEFESPTSPKKGGLKTERVS